MSIRCPNCHAEIVRASGNSCPSCGFNLRLIWTCPICRTWYSCTGEMRFCPACRAEHDRLEKEYWDNKRSGLRSVSDDIVARILANKQPE